MSQGSSKNTFFASSDDEEADLERRAKAPPQDAETQLVPATQDKPCGKRLFFADSDDEENEIMGFPSNLIPQIMPAFLGEDSDDSDTQIQLRRASTPSHAFSGPASSIPSSSPHAEAVRPPTKKRRLSSPGPATPLSQPPFTSAYIGCFLVGNAWSTVCIMLQMLINDDELNITPEGQRKRIYKTWGRNQNRARRTRR